MFRLNAWSIASVALSSIDAFTDDDAGLNLLQMKAASQHTPGKSCYLQGDPHAIESHVGNRGAIPDPQNFGLFQVTESVDKRFSVQAYQCPSAWGTLAYLSMAAYKFDDTTIVIRGPTLDEVTSGANIYFHVSISGDPTMYDVGPSQEWTLPAQIPGTDIKFENHGDLDKFYIKHPDFIALIDGHLDPPRGETFISIISEYKDSSQIPDLTSNMLCTLGGDATNIDWSASLFSADDHDFVCDFCQGFISKFGRDWHRMPAGWHNEYTCEKPPPRPPPHPAQEDCEIAGCAFSIGEQLCASLKGSDKLYDGCVQDFCNTCDETLPANTILVANEFNEEPTCITGAAECNPSQVCDTSVKMNALTVSQSNLGGAGPDTGAEELRFSNAGVINGRTIDLVVTTEGVYTPHRAPQTGTNGFFGVINLKSNSETTLNFQAVDSNTGDAVRMDTVALSFYDIDEGKKGTSRSSVQVCGSTGAIVSSNSELTMSTVGTCNLATSSTTGTGKDNPTSPFTMDPVQRARSVTFPIKNTDKVTASLSIAEGHGGRNFLFAFEPTLACQSDSWFGDEN